MLVHGPIQISCLAYDLPISTCQSVASSSDMHHPATGLAYNPRHVAQPATTQPAAPPCSRRLDKKPLVAKLELAEAQEARGSLWPAGPADAGTSLACTACRTWHGISSSRPRQALLLTCAGLLLGYLPAAVYQLLPRSLHQLLTPLLVRHRLCICCCMCSTCICRQPSWHTPAVHSDLKAREEHCVRQGEG
jgi:hypothetical protein